MGARQSRRSVDITTTSKRDDSENPGEGEGRLEKISELENKIATNGSIHNEIEYADKEETEKEEAEAAVKENGVSDSEGSKTPDADVSVGDQLNESSDLAEKSGDSLEKPEDTNESNKKNKEKSKKKKWSFRSISFSKKDKSKPGKESEKNGDVKEVNEEGAEETVATPTLPEAGKSEEAVIPANSTTAENEPTLTNGEATCTSSTEIKTEVAKPSEVVESNTPEPASVESKVEEIKKEETVVVKEESNVETPKDEHKIEVNDSKVEVDQPKVEVDQPKVEEQKIVDAKPDEHVVAESKEVRNEEIPPPLPSSNPPSPVTVFAESTMADVPPVEQVPVAKSPDVESAHPSVLPDPPLPPSSPVPDATNVPNKGDSPQLPAQSLESASDIPSLESVATTDLPPAELPKSNTDLHPDPATESLIEIPPEPVKESLVDSLPEPVKESLVDSLSEPVIESQADTLSEPVKQSLADVLPEPVTESPQIPVEEPLIECVPSPVQTSSPPEPEIEPSSPIKECEPTSLSNPIEQVINADSLPDISTESLPSLPEPLSESLPEPMSLPPVDCIPEPIAPEVLSNSLTEPIPNIPSESEKVQESIADIPLPNSEVILTNGDAHSPPSPVVNDTALTTPHEGPIKQVIAASEISEGKEEERHENSDKNEVNVPEPTTVEE